MEIVNLKCNNCGADLKLKKQIKFFTCTFCNSSLTIKNTGSIAYTEVLGEIKSNTEYLVNNSETILIEKEIARLDREWIIEKENYKISTQSGSKLPKKHSGISTILASIVALIFVFFWLSSFLSMSNAKGEIRMVFTFFGLVMIIAIIVSAFSSISNSSDYHDAEKDYLGKRSELLKKLKR